MALTSVKGEALAVAAALDVLRDGGIDALVMRAVAARAGVTPPAVYWYFRDKDALVAALVAEARRLFHDRLVRQASASAPLDRLLGALAAFRDLAIEDPHVFELLFIRSRGPVRVRPATPGENATIFQLLVDRVNEAVTARDLRRDDATDVALTLAAMCQGAALLYRRGRFKSDAAFRRFFDSAVQRLIRGLAN